MQDFFEQQHRARSQSGRLILLFSLAIAGILLSTYFVALFVVKGSQTLTGLGRAMTPGPSLWDPQLLGLTLLIVLTVTGLAALYRLNSLRGGGAAVAELVGARPVPSGTDALAERRLVNVVEEMALAAGVPVPRVYVIDDEPGINAFAAGYTQNDAVVAVTSGLLEQLDRDELQGVVAHEFGHVFSGDMRLKCRLIAALFGISALALVGRVMLQSLSRVNMRKGSGAAVLVLLAVASLMLIAIGALGLLMGRAIKAAVSRQREYLADASAVQFTRDPAGLAGALKKIARGGSGLKRARAQELSHLYFASSGGAFLSRLMATHPPLAERIRRLDPGFDPDELRAEPVATTMSRDRLQPAGAGVRSELSVDVSGEARDLMARVGTLDAKRLPVGFALEEQVPLALREALGDPFGAAATLYALLLDADSTPRARQYALIRKHSGPELLEETLRLDLAAKQLASQAVLPCANLALPALREMNARQRHAFTATMRSLIDADFARNVREFAIARMVTRRLAASDRRAEPRVALTSRSALEREARVLLSVLARAGHGEEARIDPAYHAGMGFFVQPGRAVPPLLAKTEASFAALGRALDLLADAEFEARGRLLEAGVLCVLHDDKLVTAEVELIQVLAAALDLPLPPLLH